MTYNLNRIFTISGASAETEEAPIAWLMDFQTGVGASGTASPQLPSAGRYGFARSFLNLWHYDSVNSSDEVLNTGISHILLPAQSVNQDSTPNSTLPRLEVSLKDSALDGKWIRFALESNPDNYLEWSASGRQDFYSDSRFHQEYFFISVGAPTLVGDSFSWARDELMVITVEDQTAPAPVSSTTGKKAWGALVELGVSADVLAIGSNEELTPGEESARLTIRYNPNLARGRKVTDDLSREWDVRGSRAIMERRFLQFDLTRVVQN